MHKLSIIVPVYNEESTIGIVLEKLIKLELNDCDKEVIVVNDGSTDKTAEVLERFKDRCKVVHKGKNEGKGSAIKIGLKHASGDIITICDADLEYDVEDIPRMLFYLISNNHDIVYGSRFLKCNPVKYINYFLGNKFITSLINLLYSASLTDAYTCYKMFRREIVNNMHIVSKRFEVEAELTCKLLKLGYQIKEIPINYTPRSFSEGKKIKFVDGVRAIFTIFKILCWKPL
jgi:glycosyltransferase involved in cell wall biosynthesis